MRTKGGEKGKNEWIIVGKRKEKKGEVAEERGPGQTKSVTNELKERLDSMKRVCGGHGPEEQVFTSTEWQRGLVWDAKEGKET